MAKKKEALLSDVIEDARSLSLEHQLELARQLAEIIAVQEKEAEDKLTLIRGRAK